MASSKNLPEIKLDIIKFNQKLKQVKESGQFGKVALAQDALEMASGLFVSQFEFLSTLEKRMEVLENEK